MHCAAPATGDGDDARQVIVGIDAFSHAGPDGFGRSSTGGLRLHQQPVYKHLVVFGHKVRKDT